jgi:transcriptional regulator with XRE-family HTH domain
MSFGRILAEARKKAGLSQKDLAAQIRKEDGSSISPQYLNDIEHDRRNPPSEFLIAQFAKVLGLPKDYLSLAAGNVPSEEHKRIISAKPDKVEQAYKAFRRNIKE